MTTRSKTPLEAAQTKLGEARKRVAVIRERERSIQIEGSHLADDVEQLLYKAGQDGIEPDVTEQRDKIIQLQAAFADLQRVEQGALAAVQAAENAVAGVRFEHAPHFQQELLEQATELETERARLEHALADLREREADHRAEWRRLAAAIPGGADPPFPEGDLVPSRLPTEPHVGVAAYVPQDTWPGWFSQCVSAAKREYALKRPMEEIA